MSSGLANINFFSDWIVRSTNPVSVCRLAVPYTPSMFCDLQKPLSSDMKAPP